MVQFKDPERDARLKAAKKEKLRLAVDPFNEYAELLDRHFFESEDTE